MNNCPGDPGLKFCLTFEDSQGLWYINLDSYTQTGIDEAVVKLYKGIEKL